MTTQHSWGGPDGQYTPPNNTPIFTTTTITYYTPAETPNTLTTLTSPAPTATTTATATTTFLQTSTTPSTITVTVSVFRPFPAPTNSDTAASTGTSSFRNNRTYWEDWSPGHRAGLVVGVLVGVMAAALVLFCMAKRCRRERRSPESDVLWGGNVENGGRDTEDAAVGGEGVGRFTAGMFRWNKKYREGKSLRSDGTGRARKVDIHRISDPVFLHSSRGGIEDIAGTDQRPTGAALLPQGSDWPMPMENETSSAATTTTGGQRRVYSQRGQSSRESPSVRAVSYKSLPAEEMTEDEEEVGRGVAKGGRRLQRRMRR